MFADFIMNQSSMRHPFPAGIFTTLYLKPHTLLILGILKF